MEKPTIEELEEILDGRDRHLVLNPDGSISTGEIKEETQGHSKSTVVVDRPLLEAAKNLFDNRLGWSDNRNPYAPRKFWADLSAVLYGEDDERTQELRK